MKEWLQSAGLALRVHLITRYGVLGDQEVVTLSGLPRRGVTASLIGRDDMRTRPTPELIQGFFTVSGRAGRGYVLRNSTTGVELAGVPRRHIRKVLDFTE